MQTYANPQAVKAATDKEAVNALTAKVAKQAEQITALKNNLESLMSILKYSSAESSDREISDLLTNFRSDWS